MANPTTDRVAIRAAVRERLVALGHWGGGEKIRTTADPQMIPEDLRHTPPFLQMFDGETPYDKHTPMNSRMVYNLGLACYADVNNVQWSMEGIEAERGITYVQDRLRIEFLRVNLGGVVDRMWVTSHQAPQLTDVRTDSGDLEIMLVAVTWLEIVVERAG